MIDRFNWSFNKRRGIIAVEFCSRHGMGAKLEWLLELLAYCEEFGLSPRIRFTHPDAVPRRDEFSPYFGLLDPFERRGRAHFWRTPFIGTLPLGKNYDATLTLDRATRLIGKYLFVKPEVLREVNGFCDRHFSGQRVLGIHYRGTDKSSEAEFVSYERAVRSIHHYLESFPDMERIFLSSDDARFITHCQEHIQSRPVIFREDSFRSENTTAIHYSHRNRDEINRDAVVNCLLLSRCDALIKTSSILSAWSKLFNPALPVVLLGKPHNLYFPEREFLTEAPCEPVS